MAAECAQAKFAAMADDRDYAAHVLFVVPWCDLFKDYGMMRHLVSERLQGKSLQILLDDIIGCIKLRLAFKLQYELYQDNFFLGGGYGVVL